MHEVYESFCNALARLFDSLFTRHYQISEEVNYLRMEIDKLRLENRRLIDLLTKSALPSEEPEEIIKQQIPRQIPWEVKRRQLESDARKRAKEIEAVKAATEEVMRRQPAGIEDEIDNLEKELGIDNDAVSK
jgi:hypothetical protein